MNKGVIIAGVAVVAIGAAVIVPRALKPKAVLEEAPVPVVQAEKPQPGDIVLYRNLVGTVEPSDVVYIYPKAAGEITDVFVKAGDVVSEGQAICKIDTKQVDSARLSMEAAKTAMDNANTNLARQQALFAAGDIASAAYEQADMQAKSARIQYDQAKLNYDYQLEFSNITAPISGTVEQCDVEVHDNVAQQSMICVISGEGSKAITFSVTEKVVDQMQVGDRVTIEKNGKEYQGSVTEISSMIDAATGLFKIKASVENGDALPTGSAVSLFVVSDQVSQAMSIPVDAIYYSGGDAYVYTYDNGVVHHIPVEVGIYDSERAEILSGLTKEDQVITTWSSELLEGARVQLGGSEAKVSGQTEVSEETAGSGQSGSSGQAEVSGQGQTENVQSESTKAE